MNAETATAKQMDYLEARMRAKGLIPERKSFSWFVPDWTSPPSNAKPAEWAAELLTLHGVGKLHVAQALALVVGTKPVDHQLFWRTLGVNPPTQREVDQARGRAERTVLRKCSKPEKTEEKTPASPQPFNPPRPSVKVSEALTGLARRK
jgi:hypothetical protein